MRIPVISSARLADLLAFAARRSPLLFLAVTLIAVTGCPDNQSPNFVSGTVTNSNKKNIAGQIKFIAPDGKTDVFGVIDDGKYTIPNPPVGTCKVIITGSPSLGGVAKKADKALENMKDSGGIKGTNIGVGETPNLKYGKEDTGKLTAEIKLGKNVKDFELDP